ncbi:Retrovirus-related Pol polyprotein from transposon TNT 1-94 [Linum grandiflorum]
MGSSTPGNVFAAGKYRPHFLTQHKNVSPSGQITSSSNSADIHCHHCQELGHYLSHYRKRNLCTYCKKSGHIITDCHKRKINNARNGHGNSNSGSSFSVQDVAIGLGSVSDVGNNNSIDSTVQDALQRVLPQALNAAFASLGISGNTPKWFLDSASFNHMTGQFDLFRDYKPVLDQHVEVANGQRLPIEGIGTVSTSNLVLPNTLHVPTLVSNLVSVGQLTENGCLVSFGVDGCVVQDEHTRKTIGIGSKQGRNFLLDHLTTRLSYTNDAVEKAGGNQNLCSLTYAVSGSSHILWRLWHSLLGHPNSARLMDMFRKNQLPVSINAKDFTIPECVDCIEAKTIALPFKSSATTISDMFDLIHTDLWGPCSTTSCLGFRYFALFIDHKSRFTWVYFLRLKSELSVILQEFVAMVKTQFNKTIKMVRSDPNGEFTTSTLHDFYRVNGILFQQSCPGVSEHNGLVERKHRHVLDMTRAILLQSRVPAPFWVEAIRTVTYLVNRQPTPTLGNISPFEILYSRRPDYSRLRVFGCTCYVLLPKKDRTKLSAKTVRCVFLGYTDHHKGYLCYDITQRRVYTDYHVVFQETSFPYHSLGLPNISFPSSIHLPIFDYTSTRLDSHPSPSPIPTSPASPSHTSSFTPHIIQENYFPYNSPSLPNISSSPHDSSSHSHSPLIPSSTSPLAEPPEPRRSVRSNQGRLPPHYADYLTYATTNSIPIPTSYRQAKDHPKWNAAMQVELAALHENHTWEIVPRPNDATVIGSRWVYTAKFHLDGTLDRYKARLVAQGFHQEYGIDYDET